MIRYIKGKYYFADPGSIIVENSSGIGFRIFVPDRSPLFENLEGEEIKVYTSMRVREDDMSLYGFDDKESLELFELLTTVNGVGSKAAMAIMSVFSSGGLKAAIATGDVNSITKAQGVGKKTAQRVILELKDKIGSVDVTGSDIFEQDNSFIPTDEKNEAIEALTALGYSKSEATQAVSKVAGEGLTCEDYIKQALKNF